MNREEAIQVLQTALTSPFIYGNYEDAIGMAIEALSQPIVCKDYRMDDDRIYCSPEMADRVVKALSADAGWIPVSERLPEKSGWYLVTIRGYETVTDVSLYSADGSAWGDVSTKQKVTAWMPLPEPYKGGDAE